MPIQTSENNPDDGATVLLNMEPNDCELNGKTQNIGWNVKDTQPDDVPNPLPSILEVQVSHKQITDRFVELLNMFEDYSKIMESEQAQCNPQPKLKRTQSEQLIVGHMPHQSDSSELLRASGSLNRVQLSDETLLNVPQKLTCETSCQTSWTILPKCEKCVKPLLKLDKPIKAPPMLLEQEQQQARHTLHIEVESVSSETALQRASLPQRMGQVLMDIWQAILAAFYMMGENFTYVLFVLLCLWCLYMIIVHYYSFLDTNLGERHIAKQALARPPPK